MARKRDISQAVAALAPIVPRIAPSAPWTAAERARAKEVFAAIRERTTKLLRGPQRTGVAYWQWVLDEHAAGRRRVPPATLEFARLQVEQQMPAEREAGEDREEDEASA